MKEEIIKLKKDKMKNRKDKKKIKKKIKNINKRKIIKRIILFIFLPSLFIIILSTIFIIKKQKYAKIIQDQNQIIQYLKNNKRPIAQFKNEAQNISEIQTGNNQFIMDIINQNQNNNNITKGNNELIQSIVNKNITLNKKSFKNRIIEEIKEMKLFLNLINKGKLINPNETFHKSENPKISIVISVYNGEPYLKSALLSIQNQDFKDIEIIIVDDCSKDNSVSLIKELMLIDPRIVLYENIENRGALYTKSKGILNCKGKYVMTLDEDDMYSNREAFSRLYEEAERNNLDILGFASFSINKQTKKAISIFRYLETPILFQPKVAQRMYRFKSNGSIKRVGNVLWNYIFRTDLFIKTIKQVDDKYFKIKMNVHDDFLLFFLLTRNAYNLKQIKRIFYLKIIWEVNPKVAFSLKEKNKNKENLDCMAYLNYIEMLLIKTNNTILDKKIPSFELNSYFLNHPCRNNAYVKEKGINICKQFLENIYIEKNIKDKILIFLNETKSF